MNPITFELELEKLLRTKHDCIRPEPKYENYAKIAWDILLFFMESDINQTRVYFHIHMNISISLDSALH